MFLVVATDTNAVEPGPVEAADSVVHWRSGWKYDRGDDHHQDHNERQEEAGQEAAHVEAADGLLNQHTVNDESDAGRDQDAESSAGREGADDEALAVAALSEGRQRNTADGGGGGYAGAGARGEDGAGGDVGVEETAGQEDEPTGEGPVHALAHARAEHQLAHEQEEGHRNQYEVGVALPRLVAEDVPQRGIGKCLHHHQGQHSESAGDVQSDEEENSHHAESGDDCHVLRSSVQ